MWYEVIPVAPSYGPGWYVEERDHRLRLSHVPIKDPSIHLGHTLSKGSPERLKRRINMASRTARHLSEIWIGHVKNGQSYLDKQPKLPNNEQQMHALRVYHDQQFPLRKRVLSRWICCQRPTIMVGELSTVSFYVS